MPIANFDDLIGTWAPATLGLEEEGSEREVFHFSPLGHFVVEWGLKDEHHLQICDVTLTEDGLSCTDRQNGTVTDLRASLQGRSLILTPPHGQHTVLRRVVEEMEAQDLEFFVKQEEGR